VTDKTIKQTQQLILYPTLRATREENYASRKTTSDIKYWLRYGVNLRQVTQLRYDKELKQSLD
jgi:hypothetical protein